MIHAEGFGSNVAVVCPAQPGFPAVRHRTFMTCFDMAKFVSVIPFPLNHQQETWERAFLHQTSKHFEKDDRAFVNDSPEHDLDAIQRRARRRGIFNCESNLSLIEQEVPGHMRSRYERYVAASKEKCSGPSVFVDLSQGGDSGHSVIDVGQMLIGDFYSRADQEGCQLLFI